jgi:hypothetical protein
MSTHIASVTVAGVLTRQAARDLHGRIFRFISRSTALPEGMLGMEIDTLMLAVRDAVVRAAAQPHTGSEGPPDA